MKITQLFESDDILEIDDSTGKLELNFDAPLKYLYRSVSKEEYDNIKETGFIEPSEFYGRIHAAAVPTGGDGNIHQVLKIRYDQRDGWKAKRAGTGVYAVTWDKIPKERITDIISPAIARTNTVLLKTKISQYMEYQ